MQQQRLCMPPHVARYFDTLLSIKKQRVITITSSDCVFAQDLTIGLGPVLSFRAAWTLLSRTNKMGRYQVWREPWLASASNTHQNPDYPISPSAVHVLLIPLNAGKRSQLLASSPAFVDHGTVCSVLFWRAARTWNNHIEAEQLSWLPPSIQMPYPCWIYLLDAAHLATLSGSKCSSIFLPGALHRSLIHVAATDGPRSWQRHPLATWRR
jgi:hypothetical protein